MPEDKGEQTLNEIQEGSVLGEEDWNQGGLGDSSTPDEAQIDPDGDNQVSTVDDDTKVDQEEPGKTEEKKEDKELSGQDDRFDKHPRFKEMESIISDLKAQNQRLQGMFDTMKTMIPQPGGKTDTESKPDYVDVTTKTQEELQDWFDEDATGFMANFAKQMRSEIRQELLGEINAKDAKTQATTSINEFADQNPGFLEKWQSGEIQKVIAAAPKGFHNPISAYYELTRGKDAIQLQIDAAVKDAVKEAEEKVTKNFKAKRRIVPVSGGAAPKNSAQDEDLKDTKTQGGLVQAITNRILKNRAA